MGKVKEKLPTPDTNPVDGDKLIEATKPKKVKEASKKTDIMRIEELKNDIDKLGSWIADIDDDLHEMNKLLIRIANRMGM